MTTGPYCHRLLAEHSLKHSYLSSQFIRHTLMLKLKNLSEICIPIEWANDHPCRAFLTELEGKCSWGKIPTNLLASSLESCVTLSLGTIVELASKVTMRPSFLEVCQVDFPQVT